jgi:ribonuclease R
LAEHGLPGIFRVHDAPASDGLAALVPIIREFDYLSDIPAADFVAGNPFCIQEVLERTKGKPEEELVSNLVLRAMQRAEYRACADGHFGLARSQYLHFTSPIRRYPDLVVHRIVKSFLQGTQGAQEQSGAQAAKDAQGTQGTQAAQGAQGTQGTQGTQGAQGAQEQSGAQAAQAAQGTAGAQAAQHPRTTQSGKGSKSAKVKGHDLALLAEHSSKQERIAEAAARESQEMKMIEFLAHEVGSAFDAVISGVARHGLFVRLANTAEGMIGLDALGNEYFAFDPQRHTLTGEESGKSYRLGQRVRVVLQRADQRLGRLDFRMAGSHE